LVGDEGSLAATVEELRRCGGGGVTMLGLDFEACGEVVVDRVWSCFDKLDPMRPPESTRVGDEARVDAHHDGVGVNGGGDGGVRGGGGVGGGEPARMEERWRRRRKVEPLDPRVRVPRTKGTWWIFTGAQ
jgi:hypothetical protein